MLKTHINVRGICAYPATHRVASYLERGEAALMGCPIPVSARENLRAERKCWDPGQSTAFIRDSDETTKGTLALCPCLAADLVQSGAEDGALKESRIQILGI